MGKRYKIFYKRNGEEIAWYDAGCDKILNSILTAFRADKDLKYTLEIYEYGKLKEIIKNEDNQNG